MHPIRGIKAPSKPGTPANDSFASLVSLNSSKSATNQLSLQERQKQLQEEKLRHEAERRKQVDSQFGVQDSSFWDTLGSGKSTPEPASAASHQSANTTSGAQSLSKTINKPFSGLTHRPTPPPQPLTADDDLLSAFNSAAPVDSSSHFPPPSQQSVQNASSKTPYEDDDDPFGLKQFGQKPAQTETPPTALNDDDDILGLLSKPVSEFQKSPEPPSVSPSRDSPVDAPSSPVETDPRDKAIAELVDMGFPADKAARALAETQSGLDVQAAVGIILNSAHAAAKQKTQQRNGSRGRHSPTEHGERASREPARSSTRDGSTGGSVPAWMRGSDSRSRSNQRTQHDQPSGSEKDVSQVAADIGSTLFKSANSLWKTSQKKVQKAVAEFQQDGDPSVPKWMRNAQPSPDRGGDARSHPSTNQARRSNPKETQPSVTDEALMLEAGSRPAKPSRSNPPQVSEPLPPRPPRETMSNNPFANRMSTQSPSRQQPQPQPKFLDSRPAKLSRQDVEAQSAQAYVSPARRKKPSPHPDTSISQQSSVSSNTSRQSTPASSNPFHQKTQAPAQSRSPRPSPPAAKPQPPPRQIPPASSSALLTSATHRGKGSEAFKRGDYSTAHTCYTAALAPLPSTHPIAIIVLCNRAVTNIKIGDPKAAVSDADTALTIIGAGKGEGEKIVVGGTEADKDMKEFFGKALMRKAEALEHMEKWADAAKVWKEAVEVGVGGSISIQGRNRCEKASAPKPPASAPVQRPPVRKPPPPKPSALADLGGAPASEAEAVKKLREANAAAEKADDEKFALSDQVDAKLLAWKGSKSDNLRALLGSLDKVLWPEAGWKKVNMGDLVMPNKVKIVYMKAIAKVHPDKVSQTATTEQRMISASVFSTLNEAWDKFKKDNNL